LALVAQGRYDGMITFRDTWEWDIAAGSLLIHEAGGRATDRQGRELVFNSPTCKANGIVAASTNLHDDICKHLEMTTN
jgi:myo-inositol-1(or 4)-monophosphatase